MKTIYLNIFPTKGHILNCRVRQQGNGTVTTVRVKIKSKKENPYTQERIIQELDDAFTYSCECTHGGCGHYQKYVSYIQPARKKKSGAIVKGCYVLQVVEWALI